MPGEKLPEGSGISQTQHPCLLKPEMQRNLESRDLRGLAFWNLSTLGGLGGRILFPVALGYRTLHVMSVRMP